MTHYGLLPPLRQSGGRRTAPSSEDTIDIGSDDAGESLLIFRRHPGPSEYRVEMCGDALGNLLDALPDLTAAPVPPLLENGEGTNPQSVVPAVEHQGKVIVAERKTRVDQIVQRGVADRAGGRSGPALKLIDIEVSLFWIRKL